MINAIMANKLKLAQFLYISSNTERLKILKEAEIFYVVPDEDPSEVKSEKSYAGYTYLHFAVKKEDLESTRELLNRGADLFQQGTHNGYTPLHAAINDNLDICYKANSIKIWELLGVLQENKLVNILLSAQVKTGKTVNPKCKKIGVSHLHIASMFNHSEAVNFLITAGVSVDETTNLDSRWLPGYTALHFAVRYSSPKAAAVLLENGADIHAKDARGISPLHLLINRLMDVTDYLLMGKQAISLPYEMEIQNIDAILRSVIKIRKAEDINFADESGLTSFHLACALKDPSFAEYFLQNNFDINVQVKSDSNLCPGWTPLHFAAFFSINTFKLLLKNGANINMQCTKGLTALNLFTRRHTPEVIRSTLSVIDEFNNILSTNKTTKLSDIIASMKDLEGFKSFLQTLPDMNISVPQNSPIWPGYTLLHLAVMMNEKIFEWQHFRATSNYSESIDSQCEAQKCTKINEEAYSKRIKAILSQNVAINMANTDGLSPLLLAFRLHSQIAVDLLMKVQKNIIGPGNLSHFHIACAADYDNIVDKFLREGADVNARVETNFEWDSTHMRFSDIIKQNLKLVTANSTPLHIAVIFKNVRVISHLLQNGADVYAKDTHERTPIHLSMLFAPENTFLAERILSKIDNLRDSVTAEGLSHLHVAAFADNAIAIKQLLENGTDVNLRFDVPLAPKLCDEKDYDLEDSLKSFYFAGETPLHVATRRGALNAVRTLIVKGNADIHLKSLNYKRMSSLHLALTLDAPNSNYFSYFVKRLKRERQHYVGPIEDTGLTMLHVACATFDLKWTMQLLVNGANVNAQVQKNTEDNDKWHGFTPLHALVYYAGLKNNDILKNFMIILKLLLKNGAVVTTLSAIGTPLHIAAKASSLHLFSKCFLSPKGMFMRNVADMLLRKQKNFYINPANRKGITHFHYACARNNLKIVKKFLDHGVDINLSNSPFSGLNAGYSPLHCSFALGNYDMAKFLIEQGADVGAQDSSGFTPLHVEAIHGYANMEMIDLMLSRGLNINAKSREGFTPMEFFLTSHMMSLGKLEYFLSWGSKIDNKSNEEYIDLMRSAMKSGSESEQEKIFQLFLHEFSLKTAIREGFCATHSFIRYSYRFNVEFYRYVIQQFEVMGCDFDQYDSEGKTALHQAAHHNNPYGVEILIMLGADIDVMDNKNNYPLTKEMLTEYTKEVFDDFYPDYDEEQLMVIEKLAVHAWKINFVALPLSNYMKRAAKAILDKMPVEISDVKILETELQKMRGINITNTITAKDFLTKWEVVRNYPSMADLQRKIIDEFFKKVDQINTQFPQFSGILLMQYRKTVARMKLHGPAMNLLISLGNIVLPEFCYEMILQEFTNKELQQFVEMADDIYQV